MRRGWFIVAVMALASCARFQPQPMSAEKNAELLEARSLGDPGLREFVETNLHRPFPAWPAQAWDFEQLTFAAFYYHPSLELARAQWAVALGGQITAAQRPNPVITATPGYDTTTSIPSPWLPLTFIDVPVETAGKRKYRRAQAAHAAMAARFNVAEAAWQVRSALRLSLIDLASAEQRDVLLQRQIALQEQIVGLLQGQVQAGAVSASEAVPFRIALLRARLDRIDAQRLTAEARARVAEAIGIPLRALDGIKLTFEGLQDMEVITRLSSGEARRNALQSRPDILGALSEYAASESALRLEIAKQYPDVHLQPGYQYDQGDNKWSLGIVVELPILSQNRGPIAEAEAKRREAAARFNAVQAKVMVEIDTASQSVRIAQENLLTLQALMQEQGKRLQSVEGQVRAGQVDRLELLNAQFENLTTELAQLDGRLKLQQALGALEDSVHRPFELPAAVYDSVPPTRWTNQPASKLEK
ncbi:MAG TPA: TolC family protein [Verrucomicrobiae bacterium]|nr:TolC family protein [Verrucomicrobiae bacterium]